ncbi:tetratricopeptide repeat protein [Peptococcaceae bacterium CEB3]|nr:tetratricopeptide repeat protein [Peptococcaceae bacterium CEB3]
MKGTALKAYLEKKNIRPSTLAKECQIDKSYLSRLLSGQRSNPRLRVLRRLAAKLGLSAAVVQELLETGYEAYVSENFPEVLAERASQERFFNCLQQVLDASDDSEIAKVADLTEIIREGVLDSFPMKKCFLRWYEAYALTFQDQFATAIPLFIEAAGFSPRYDVERRFKAKVLLGLGTAYLARGEYRQSVRFFRESLLFWNKGFQVGRVYMNLGTLYRRCGSYERSVDAYERAYECGAAVIKLYTISGLIQVSLDKKDYNVARKWVMRGYSQAKRTGAPRGKSDLYCNIAEYYLASEKLHRADFFFRKAIFFADNSGSIRTKQWAEVELAVLLLRRGLVMEFQDMVRKLESELSGREDVLLIGKHLNAKGRRCLERREYASAAGIAQKAYALVNSSASSEAKECCTILYKAYKALREPGAAAFYLKEIKKHEGVES